MGRWALLRHGASTSSTPRVLVNSLPKSGTHLLIKVLESLPGMYRVRFQLSPKAFAKFRPRGGEPVVPAGIASPVSFSRARVHRVLSRLPPAAFCTAHMPYSDSLAAVMASLGMRMVLIIRDPRDVAVSSARFLADRQRNPLHGHFADLSQEERVLRSLCGITSRDGQPVMRSIRERLESVLPWASHPWVHVTRFEALVGEAGGGTRTAQLDEIRGIAAHLGIDCPEERLRSIAGELFGGTGTFRKGQIGAWRRAFTPRLVDAAQPLLADLLVELGYEREPTWPVE